MVSRSCRLWQRSTSCCGSGTMAMCHPAGRRPLFCVVLAGKGVASAVWGIYNGWCIQIYKCYIGAMWIYVVVFM